jgi:peptidoglycan/xylan/chitin deacetylase (PgdA/CDA1 family)
MSILCYHTVDPNWNGPLGVSPQAFAQHCSWLKTNRRVVNLESAVTAVRPSGSLPGGMVALTFDDGLSALHEHALPILLSYRLPATVFLVAQTLTAKGRPVDWIDGKDPGMIQTLNVEQVLEMQDAGISFGSHSYAHMDLRQLSDEEIRRDLHESKEVLETVLQSSVWCLAYPRGLHDARVRGAARAVGYTHALGLSYGGPATDAWGIPRIGVYAGNDALALRIKTSSWYPPVRLHLNRPISEEVSPRRRTRDSFGAPRR